MRPIVDHHMPPIASDRRHDRAVLVRPRSSWTPHPNLLVNPAGDTVFGEHVRWLAARSGDPTELQAALRRTFPGAVVRRRELSGETFELWYVYRDGHWSPPLG